MASYDNLSDSELRQKLLEIGLDLPVSINREFLIKKLKSFNEPATKNGSRRKSLGRVTAVEEEIQPKLKSTTRGKSRLSLGDMSLGSSGSRNNNNTSSNTGTWSPASKRRSLTRSNDAINANNNTSMSTTTTTTSNAASNKSRVHSPPLNSVIGKFKVN